jgi:ABC-type taurine transport system ATPase subunit
VIITRDVWMHGIDIARAAGKELELTDDYDGRVIAYVVADWGRRHVKGALTRSLYDQTS